MALFIAPLILLSLHAFSNHEHGVCISKIETHLHEKDIDCKLHLIKQQEAFLPDNHFEISELNTVTYNPLINYNFLKKYSQLSFSLRGPPAFS